MRLKTEITSQLVLLAIVGGLLIIAVAVSAISGMVQTVFTRDTPDQTQTSMPVVQTTPLALPPTAFPTFAVPVTITPAARPVIATPLPSIVPAVTLLTGYVLPDIEYLNLRDKPATNAVVLNRIMANTALNISGQSSDTQWLNVRTTTGLQGWVMSRYIQMGPSPQMPSVQVVPRKHTNTSAIPSNYPFLSSISAKIRDIFDRGQRSGNRANSFAIVGDSNSENAAFLSAFDGTGYRLAEYDSLQPTIEFFKGSFARKRPAAVGGFNTTKIMDAGQANPDCETGESPLVCEYRLTRPAFALILLGTGDQHSWQGFGERYRRIIDFTLSKNIVPVLITKADDLESKENSAPTGYTNAQIRQIAAEYDVMLLDFRMVVDQLPNRGCVEDGFHYNVPPDNNASDFSKGQLQYGFTQRNLTALQTLDFLRRSLVATEITPLTAQPANEATPQPVVKLSPLRIYTRTLDVRSYGWQQALSPTQPDDLIYPYPRMNFDQIGALTAMTMNVVVLESPGTELTIAPELGGRILRWVDRKTQQDVLYVNPVIKPTRWGYRGWWLAAGGIEFCFPVPEHGLNEWRPWQYETHVGSTGVHITLHDHEDRTGLDVAVDISLSDDDQVSISPRVTNRTDKRQQFQFWINAQLPYSPNSDFDLPASRVLLHSTGDTSLPASGQAMSWPSFNNRDFSKANTWQKYLGVFADDLKRDSVSVRNEDTKIKVVRQFPKDKARGIKLFLLGDLPSALYTDGDSRYMELWGGYTKTFDDYAAIEPNQTMTWTETWSVR